MVKEGNVKVPEWFRKTKETQEKKREKA